MLRPFAPLYAFSGVLLGVQSLAKARTANAVVLAAPGAPFLHRWADGYHSFDGADWDAHSVRLPAALAGRHPGEVLWLPPAAWFDPGPDDAPALRLFGANVSDEEWAGQPARLAQHAWHHLTAGALDAVAGPRWVGSHPCTLYARMLRSVARAAPGGRMAAALGDAAAPAAECG